MKRSRVRPYRTEPRRRLAPHEDAQWWAWATMMLLARSGSRCERCGHPLGNNLERHHRQRRTVGGDRLSNLMALHTACHQWITEHPESAREQGWIVSAAAPDPELVPCRLPDGYLWILRDDGIKIPAP